MGYNSSIYLWLGPYSLLHPPTPPPMAPIRLGFVGLSTTGWASLTTAPAILSMKEKFTITATSTSSQASALESAKKYSELVGREVKPYHGDTSEIANNPDVDMVAVSIKGHLHRAAVLPVLAAKKDIFIEWPAGRNLEECIEMAELAKKNGVKSLVGLQGRVSPVVKKVAEIVKSGKIGKILSTSIIALGPRELKYWGPIVNEHSVHTLDQDLGSSVLRIDCGHLMSAFHLILGQFTSVAATSTLAYPKAIVAETGETVNTTAHDHVSFSGLLESGALASVTWRAGYTSTPGRKQFVWIIDGEDGSLTIENDTVSGAFIHIRHPTVYLNGVKVEIKTNDDDIGPKGNVSRLWATYAAGEGYPTLDDAVDVHCLLDAVELSAKEGRTVTVPVIPNVD